MYVFIYLLSCDCCVLYTVHSKFWGWTSICQLFWYAQASNGSMPWRCCRRWIKGPCRLCSHWKLTAQWLSRHLSQQIPFKIQISSICPVSNQQIPFKIQIWNIIFQISIPSSLKSVVRRSVFQIHLQPVVVDDHQGHTTYPVDHRRIPRATTPSWRACAARGDASKRRRRCFRRRGFGGIWRRFGGDLASKLTVFHGKSPSWMVNYNYIL